MKKKSILICLFLLLLLSAIFCFLVNQKSKQKQSNVNDLCFLKTYGSINYVDNQSNSIDIAFVSSSSINFAKEVITLSFDNPNVSCDDIVIKKSFSYGQYTLWYLQFDIIIDTSKLETNNIELHKLSLNNYTNKDLGNLAIRIIKGDNNLFSNLKLQSCTGASMGTKLSDYHAELKNICTNSLFIDSVEIPMYNNATFSFTVDNVNYTDLNKLEIKPKQDIQFSVSLSDCFVDSVNVYYVSPLLTYHDNVSNQDTCIAFNYYTSGLNITKEQLASIVNEFMEEKIE